MYSSNTYYGWIPTLAGNIFLFNPFLDEIKYKSIQRYSKEIPSDIYEEVNANYHALVNEINPSDNEKKDGREKAIVIYAFKTNDHNYLERLYLLREKEDNTGYKLLSKADIISLSENGLIKFNVYGTGFLAEKEIKQEIVNQIYINIRDAYHKHTHHDGDNLAADSLAPCCLGKTDEDGICRIIDTYLRKIIYYHGGIQSLIHHNIQSKNQIVVAVELIRQASGEFLYAQNFCVEFGDLLDFRMKEKYIQTFANNIQSMNIFHNEINAKYSYETSTIASKQNKTLIDMTASMTALTGKMTSLTTLMTFLTILLAFLTIISLLKQFNII